MMASSLTPPSDPSCSLEGPESQGLPRRFGKYTLIRKLATGGMAELFLALQKSVAGFEKLLVIKRILPAMTQDPGFIEMLLQEARIAATLSHANIVQVFDVGQVDGTYFIAMEHLHGEDLRGIVRQMRKKGVIEFPLEHAIEIMLGVTSGLSYAHEKRDLDGSPLHIVHRDISPQNVVVTFSGDVKIVDFGIAKSDANMQLDTKSGKLKGKIPYMSPEQARGEPLDARSDIFAVGVMLFELTTGRRLFKGQSEFETLKLICEREYPRPSSVRPGYPPELESIVMRALAKDKSGRFQSARQLQSALEDYVRRERIPVSNVALTQYMQLLFEDKLQAEKEQLLQGKQLADIVERERPAETAAVEQDPQQRLSSSLLTAPSAAARTVTEIRSLRRSTPLKLTAIGALVSGGVIAAAVYGWRTVHREPVMATVVSPPPAKEPSPVKVSRGAIALTSTPPGATIWVDGEMRSEVTPAQIEQLPLGRPFDVKLTKEGFEAAKQSFTLTDAAPNAQWDPALNKGSVGLEVNLAPPVPGAVLLLDGKAMAGTSLGDVTSDIQHTLVVGAPGYVDQEFTFIGAPLEKKHFDVTLQKDAHRAHSHVAASTSAGSGKLNVGVSPGWCNVTVDGVARGATPVAGIELAAGNHRVVCDPPDHAPIIATVVVPADGTARYRFNIP